VNKSSQNSKDSKIRNKELRLLFQCAVSVTRERVYSRIPFKVVYM